MHWAAVLLWILFWTSCTGGDDERGPGEPPSGQFRVIERYVALSDETVRDTRTGLEWTRLDSNRGVNWHEAVQYCEELTVGGQTDWRLPEIGELRDLYDERLDQPCGEWTCHLDPMIDLTDPYFWSETEGSPLSRFYFDFRFGTSLSPHVRPDLVRRALCVRQRPA